MKDKKRKMFNFEIDAQHRNMLKQIAKVDQRSQGGELNWLIQQRYDQLPKSGVKPALAADVRS